MSGTLDHKKDPRYTRSGAVHVPAGGRLDHGGPPATQASAESTKGSLGLVLASVPPGGGPIAHAHTRSDEAFYVRFGELELLDGARTFVARTGDGTATGFRGRLSLDAEAVDRAAGELLDGHPIVLVHVHAPTICGSRGAAGAPGLSKHQARR